MSPLAIVTDSIASLSREQIEQYDIHIVPIKILFGDRIYRNGIDLSAAEAYQLLDKAPELFTTSPSSPSDYAAIFRKLAAEKKAILCISVSSRLSTAFNMAKVAKEQIQQEYSQAQIEVIDSYSAVAGQGFVVMAAARLAAQGKGLTEVARVARLIKERVQVLFVFETIRHAYRTGRIPEAASRIGSMLGVKPIVNIADGQVKLIGVSRSKKGGVSRIIKIMRQQVGTKPVHIAVMHADVPAESVELKKRVAAEFNCEELFISEFSPIIGYATGRGVLGLAFYTAPAES